MAVMASSISGRYVIRGSLFAVIAEGSSQYYKYMYVIPSHSIPTRTTTTNYRGISYGYYYSVWILIHDCKSIQSCPSQDFTSHSAIFISQLIAELVYSQLSSELLAPLCSIGGPDRHFLTPSSHQESCCHIVELFQRHGEGQASASTHQLPTKRPISGIGVGKTCANWLG